MSLRLFLTLSFDSAPANEKRSQTVKGFLLRLRCNSTARLELKYESLISHLFYVPKDVRSFTSLRLHRALFETLTWRSLERSLNFLRKMLEEENLWRVIDGFVVERLYWDVRGNPRSTRAFSLKLFTNQIKLSFSRTRFLSLSTTRFHSIHIHDMKWNEISLGFLLLRLTTS